MWRDDSQASEAIWTLLQRAQLPALQQIWGHYTGPSNQAWELYDAKGGPLSSGEKAMLFAAFAFWNGSEGLDFSTLVHGPLDSKRARLLCELAIAVQEGGGAIERWIEAEAGRAVETCPVCLMPGHEPITLPSGERCCPFKLRTVGA